MLAADSAVVNTDAELEEFLKGHFAQIRGNALFAEIDIVAIIEQNYGTRVATLNSKLCFFFLTTVRRYASQEDGSARLEWRLYVLSSTQFLTFLETPPEKTE